MRYLKFAVLLLAAAILALPLVLSRSVHSQETPPVSTTGDGVSMTDQANKVSGNDTLASPTGVDNEGVDPNSTDTFSLTADDPANNTVGQLGNPCIIPRRNAPANFDNQTNGFLNPGDFADAKDTFEEIDEIDDGLGPVYNAQRCSECHQNPVTGGISQITELRAGHNICLSSDGGNCAPDQTFFVDAPGGSLINDRSIPTNLNDTANPNKNAKLQERVPPLYTAGVVSGGPITQAEPVRTFRTSLNVLGDGFVEATANGTLLAIRNRQDAISGGVIKGMAIKVPVLETAPNSDPTQPFPGSYRLGRFGWKDQHASLLSFSGDAYLNEVGITNFLILNENSSLGRSVAAFDPKPDPSPNGEDAAQDVLAFTDFMRSTKAPPLDEDIKNQFLSDWTAGRALFMSLPPSPSERTDPPPVMGCSICHIPAIVTVKPCTRINGGEFTVPAELGNKIFRPFGDFLLHDINTGDGIVQNGGQKTRLRVRTAPLWGVRTRDRLMHNGETFDFKTAILQHGGEATIITNRFQNLTNTQKKQLIIFLESL
ncbi:MAG: hypothetical protein JOZ52_08130 [Acidobacteria bacterium]|nr:hypothetical protein [Acidobacteriota bacterium]